jgi:hypothetical protein
MPPDTAYTAQEIFEAYKEALAMNALNQRRLLARIVDLEQEIAALKMSTTKNGVAKIVASAAP